MSAISIRHWKNITNVVLKILQIHWKAKWTNVTILSSANIPKMEALIAFKLLC